MIALRPTRPTAQATRAFSGLALGLTLAVTVLAAPGSARAADDETPLDTKIMRGILEGIGLKRENRVINYQERPPLVIPPSKSLPPPGYRTPSPAQPYGVNASENAPKAIDYATTHGEGTK